MEADVAEIATMCFLEHAVGIANKLHYRVLEVKTNSAHLYVDCLLLSCISDLLLLLIVLVS